MTEPELTGEAVTPRDLGAGVLRRVTRADAVASDLRVGVSAPRELEVDQGPVSRQAHGLTVRYSPWTPIVLLGEANVLKDTGAGWGYVGMATLEDRVRNGGRNLARVQALVAEYEALKSRERQLTANVRGGSPAQALEELAKSAKLADRITSIQDKPIPPTDQSYKESAVEIAIEGAALEPLFTYLVSIERKPDMRLHVRRLRIDAKGEEGKRKLDANLLVASIDPTR